MKEVVFREVIDMDVEPQDLNPVTMKPYVTTQNINMISLVSKDDKLSKIILSRGEKINRLSPYSVTVFTNWYWNKVSLAMCKDGRINHNENNSFNYKIRLKDKERFLKESIVSEYLSKYNITSTGLDACRELLSHEEFCRLFFVNNILDRVLINYFIIFFTDAVFESDNDYPLLNKGGASFLEPFYFKCDNYMELTRRIFGKTRYRKDLVKAVAENNSMVKLKIAYLFRGLVPIDYIINFLRNYNCVDEIYNTNFKSPVRLRAFLRILDERSAKRLLRSLTENKTIIYNDVARDFINFLDLDKSFVNNKFVIDKSVTRVDSWKELHDRQFAYYNIVLNKKIERDDKLVDSFEKVKRERFCMNDPEFVQRYPELCVISSEGHKGRRENFDVINDWFNEHAGNNMINYNFEQVATVLSDANLEFYDKSFKSLHNKKINDSMKVKLADDTFTLLEWSNIMRNCISSYNFYRKEKSMLLGGVFDKNDLIANFEVDMNYLDDNNNNNSLVLKQLLGQCNYVLPDNVRRDIVDFLNASGVDTSKRWIGSF